MLYAIAGNGTGPVKEITGALKDLREKATAEKVDFWIVLEGKDEPTKTDNDILKWMGSNGTWFEVYTSTGTTYDNAQQTMQVDDPYVAMLERLQEVQGAGEDAALLVVLEDENADDESLQTLVETAIDGDIPVYQLNGEMARITLEDDGGQPEPEPEPEPEPVKATTSKKTATKAAEPVKKATKKAAATISPEDEPEEADEEVAASVVYTPEELQKMTVAELGAVARGQGVDAKGMNKRDLVTAIQAAGQGTVEDVGMAGTDVQISGNVNGDVVLVVIHLPNTIVTKFMPEAAALALAAS